MSPNTSQNNQNSSVLDSSSSDDAFVQKKIDQMYDHSRFRNKCLEIIEEHTGTVNFMNTVKEYADKQIDERLFKNAKVVMSLIIGWVATTAVTVLVTWLQLK